MSKVVVAEPENQETYHSENFKLNKKKSAPSAHRFVYTAYYIQLVYTCSFVYYRNNVF